MTTTIELIKEVKSKINNRIYRVQKFALQGLDYYVIDTKTDLGYRVVESTYSEVEMNNSLSLIYKN